MLKLMVTLTGVVRKEGRYVPSIRFGKRMNRVAQEKADEGEEEVE